jgi:hypothetical protein
MRRALYILAQGAPSWLLAYLDPPWAERSETRVGDVRLPNAEKKWAAVAEMSGARWSSCSARHSAASPLPRVQELDAVHTLRCVWSQQAHAGEQGMPWRADGERPSLIVRPAPVAQTAPPGPDTACS